MTTALCAVAKTHPDPLYQVHQHMVVFTAHSLRVFACICLKLENWDKEDIVHQLHWDSTAIKFNIRQAIFQADAIEASLFNPALVLQVWLNNNSLNIYPI